MAQATDARKRDRPEADPPTAAATEIHATAHAACGRRWTAHRRQLAPAQAAASPATTHAAPEPAGTPRWRSLPPGPTLAACATLLGVPGSARSAHHRKPCSVKPARLPTEDQPACQRAPRRFVQERNPSLPASLHSADAAEQSTQCARRPCIAQTTPGAAVCIPQYRIVGTAARSSRRGASHHRATRHSASHTQWPKRARRFAPDGLRSTMPDAAFPAKAPSGLSGRTAAIQTPRVQWGRGIPPHLRR